MELASEHITVNAYAPGIVGTVSAQEVHSNANA
jgi:NAD(P)-dependent dehydrogenase (short-subunit alcohol dehydrogenase family)